MGKAFEVVSGFAVNPGATITVVTDATGDSHVVRSFDISSSMAHLENAWALGGTAGVLRVRSPRLHDVSQGIRMNYAVTDPRPLLSWWGDEPLYAQDSLIVELSGGGAETDGESLLVYYENLPGVNARLAMWSDIQPRIQHIMTVEVDLTTGATAGNYGGSATINSNFDLLKANIDYAILGYTTSVSCQTVGIKSPDFGNLRVGGPGHIQRDETRNWFVNLSDKYQRPHIPIFNAANKGSTFVDLVHNATATAIVVTLQLAQLS